MITLALFSSTFFYFSYAKHLLIETSDTIETNRSGFDYGSVSGCENLKQNYLVSCAKKEWFIFWYVNVVCDKLYFCRKISSSNCSQKRIGTIKSESDCQKEVNTNSAYIFNCF